MPIISHRLRLVYFDIPKVACTSLKTLFWEIENGRDFPGRNASRISRAVARLSGRKPLPNSIHECEGYMTWSFERSRELAIPDGYDWMTVLRDPIARLHSGWSNKANDKTFAGRNELEDLRNDGLCTAPSFAEFIRHFERYQAVSRPVRVHTHPYAWHLGPDLMAFAHRFRIEELDGLQGFLSERAGARVELPWRNRSDAVRDAVELGPAEIDKLIALTRGEYAWLGGLYDQEEGLARLMGRSPVTS